ncbi:hypothetical protein FQN50_008448 [Emmonsiellopsis sp. PD_5]|nr:hypothetical protein FQN50_008448 [Emmonsiellopsis sp. PD_5]
MATPELKAGVLAELMSTPNLPSVTFIVTALTLLAIYILQRPKSKLFFLNPKRRFEFSQSRAKNEFVGNANEMVKQGFAATGNKPFRMISDMGEVTVLPPEITNEIKNDHRLDFGKSIHETMHGRLPGFECFRTNGDNMLIGKSVVQRQLTTYLNRVTKPLSDEATYAFKKVFTDDKEWHKVSLKTQILQIVARLSSRVFLGDELCRNEEWLDISINFTVIAFQAAQDLKMYPYYLRDIVHWFLPGCRQLRAQKREAHKIIEPILKKRAEQKAALAAQGKKAEFNDAIEWFEQAGAAEGVDYDRVVVQLGLSLAAIHTTTDLLTQVIFDLAENQEIIQPLRNEIIEALSTTGWKKASLYKMKLLDSVIKESQRLKPIASCKLPHPLPNHPFLAFHRDHPQLTRPTKASMSRLANDDVRLSDGTVIPKNSITVTSSHRMWDPAIHENPEKWDGYRFYKMRQVPGQENSSQFVTTSPNHLAFGHGQHACPGRFFAGNEVKVALCHLLLKYDIRVPEGEDTKPLQFGFNLMSSPFAGIMMRRRAEELDLDALEA